VQQAAERRLSSSSASSSSSTDETTEVVAQVDRMLQDSWEKLKKDLKKELPEDQVHTTYDKGLVVYIMQQLFT
jgi:hypothetical protein